MSNVSKFWSLAILSAALSVCGAAHAQTNATGQVINPTAPGAGINTTCPTVDSTAAMTATNNDANCGAALTAGFASPTLPQPAPEPPVIALIRVSSVVDKPAAFPFPIEFNVVGDATMVKARMPRLNACFSAGKGWTRRSNAATSTTCVDQKGEVIAYQECKPGANGEPMTCQAVTPTKGDTVARR